MEALPGHLERLPAGHDPRQLESLGRDHRERILIAMAEIVARRGYRGATVERVVKRAGVARVTFYANFENREDCLLACFDQAVDGARARILDAVEPAGEREWPELVRDGLAALLEFAGSEPALARTAVVETMTAGAAAMARYERAMQSFTPFFAAGRAVSPDGELLPETLEESIVGGIVWMLHQRLQEGRVDEIPAQLPTMLEFALAPYVGAQRAAEVAAASA